MPNQYVNKVVKSNGETIIDITDTTAAAEDVASGKYFYTASGERTEGTASGGGGGSYSGTFTPASREANYTFYAPGCTYIAVVATTPPSTSTGMAFIYASVGYVDRLYATQSTNSGSGNAGGNDTGKVSYANDTFTINYGNANNSKTPQVGTTYAWCAW